MTAVEYLIEELKRIGFTTNNIVEFENEVQIAKEMELQQMKDAYINGGKSGFNAAQGKDLKTFEDSYSETYGNKTADT